MATFRLFKTSYTDRKGKKREAAKWYIEFKDALSTVRRLPAYTSRAASEEMGRNLVRLVEYHRGSGGQTDPQLMTWLSGLPAKTREKLVAIGLLNPERAATSKPLADHLADFRRSLESKGCSGRHVELVASRARKIIDGCRFRYLADIQASKVQSFLHDRRQGEKGISAQT